MILGISGVVIIILLTFWIDASSFSHFVSLLTVAADDLLIVKDDYCFVFHCRSKYILNMNDLLGSVVKLDVYVVSSSQTKKNICRLAIPSEPFTSPMSVAVSGNFKLKMLIPPSIEICNSDGEPGAVSSLV